MDVRATGEEILLIEDELTIPTLVAEELESGGYRVLQRRTAKVCACCSRMRA